MHMTDTAQVNNVMELLMKGGIIMIPIILLSLVSFYLFIERFIYIRKSTEIDQSLVTNIVTDIKKNQTEKALKGAMSDQTAAGRIFETGIQQMGRPVKEV